MSVTASSLRVQLPGGTEEILAETEFDVGQYVTKLRRVVPAHQLQSALQTALNLSNSRITNVLNEKHKLIADLANSKADSIKGFRDVTERVPSLEKKLDQYIKECGDLLHGTRDVWCKISRLVDAHERDRAQLEHETVQLVMLKGLAKSFSHFQASSTNARPRSPEISLLTMWAKDVVDAEARIEKQCMVPVPQLTALIHDLRNAVVGRLESCLGGLLSNLRLTDPSAAAGNSFGTEQLDNDAELIAVAAAGLQLLGRQKLVEDQIRENFTKHLFYRHWAQFFGGGTLRHEATKTDFENAILFFEQCQRSFNLSPGSALLKKICQADSALLVNAVAVSFCECVAESMTAIFAPVFPELFAAVEKRWHAVVRSIMSYASESERQQFFSSAQWRSIKSRWKNEAYQSLQGRLLLKQLDEVLICDQKDQGSDATAATQASCHLVVKQVLQSLENMHRDAVEVNISFTVIAEVLLLRLKPLILSCATTPLQCCLAMQETLYVSTIFTGDTFRQQSELVDNEESSLSIEALCDGLKQEFSNCIGELADIAVSQMRMSMAYEFRAIQGIPPIYRMTKKPVPIKASPYVLHVTKRLQELKAATQNLSAVARSYQEENQIISNLYRRMVTVCAKEATDRIVSVIAALNQQERSLRRFQKNVIADPNEPNDAYKICLQLQLDLRALQECWQNEYDEEEVLHDANSVITAAMAQYASATPAVEIQSR